MSFAPTPSSTVFPGHSTRHARRSSGERSGSDTAASSSRKMAFMNPKNYDSLALIKANTSVIYPQYPPDALTVALSTMTSKEGRRAFYVAIFALLPDSSPDSRSAIPGVAPSSPRLLETGPPKQTVAEAIEAMLETFLGHDIARIVNEQAHAATKVPRKHGDTMGYTFLWGDGCVPTVSNPNRDQGPSAEPPPAYED